MIILLGVHLELQHILLITAFLLFGCISTDSTGTPNTTQSQTQYSNNSQAYLCPDGSFVSSLSDCPKVIKTYLCPDGTVKLSLSECSSEISSIQMNNSSEPSINPSIPNSSIETNETLPSSPIPYYTGNSSASTSNNSSNLSPSAITTNWVIYLNKKRNDFLNRDERLRILAEKCNTELAYINTTNLTTCYQKYGDFRLILKDLGFIGPYFVYASQFNNSGNISPQDISASLSTEQRYFLLNKTIDPHIFPPYLPDTPLVGFIEKPFEQPYSLDSIGSSVICSGSQCFHLTVTAGTKRVERMDLRSCYGECQYSFFKEFDSSFRPVKLSFESDSNCQVIFYKNTSLSDAQSRYYWSDYWGGDWSSSYDERLMYSTSASKIISEPTVAFIDCYPPDPPTKQKLEVTEELVDAHRSFSSDEINTIIDNRTHSATRSAQTSLLDALNSRRQTLGLEPLEKNTGLSALAELCTNAAHQNNYDWKDCYSQLAPPGSKAGELFYRLSRDGLVYGPVSIVFFNSPNVSSPEFYLDEIPSGVRYPFGSQEHFFGQYSGRMQSFGSYQSCSGNVCTTTLIVGANRDSYYFPNVKYGSFYGYVLMRSFKGRSFSADELPNITYHLNSSTEASFAVYPGKEDWSDVLNLVNSNYYFKQTTTPILPGFNFNGNLSGGFYFFAYNSKDHSLSGSDKKGNFSLDIVIIPPN